MDFFAFEPATFWLLWGSASNFLTTGEGGRFRWGNIYGNTALILLGCFSNSSSAIHATKEQALTGMAIGALATVMPVTNFVKWRRMIPTPYAAALGTATFGYYAHMYYQETMGVEDAGED